MFTNIVLNITDKTLNINEAFLSLIGIKKRHGMKTLSRNFSCLLKRIHLFKKENPKRKISIQAFVISLGMIYFLQYSILFLLKVHEIGY